MRHSRTLRRLVGVITVICGLPNALAQCTPYWSGRPMDETPRMNGGYTIRTFSENGVPVIYFGTSNASRQLVRWDGSQITAIPNDPSLGTISCRVWDIELLDYPSTQAQTLYVVLRPFLSAGAVAMLNPSFNRLELVGPVSGAGYGAFDVVAFDLGLGPELFATTGQTIARWNGVEWQQFAAFDTQLCWPARMRVWNDGNGPALYCVGSMRQIFPAGGSEWITVNGVAKFDGQVWSALGGGLASSAPTWCQAASAFTVTAFDDGSGEALYVGGVFEQAGGVPAAHIARWDGQQWSAVGGATTLDPDREITRLRVLNDGTGDKLYACGTFREIGGVQTNGLAVWDGVSWSAPPGAEFIPSEYGEIYDLAFFDDGDGMSMYVNGEFTHLGATNIFRFARYGCRCPDLTGDDFVGLDDLALVLGSFGGPTTARDPDRDGDMDLHDLSVLLSYFGMTCP